MASVSRNANMIRVGAGNIKAWAEQIVETITSECGRQMQSRKKIKRR